MNFLNYSLTALVCFVGLFAGFFLAIIAKEELKIGKKYFVFLQKIILLLIFVFLLVFIKLNYILVLLILAFIAVYAAKNYFKDKFDEMFYVYIILAVIFYLSSKELNLFIIESSLIFLYGLPSGSLLMRKSKKETLLCIIRNIDFVLIAMALQFIF